MSTLLRFTTRYPQPTNNWCILTLSITAIENNPTLPKFTTICLKLISDSSNIKCRITFDKTAKINIDNWRIEALKKTFQDL
jgi:hypothetical protein